MKKSEVLRNKAIEELKNNDELFVNVVNELDSWNGFADGFRAYDMDELDDLHHGMTISDFLNVITSDFNLNDNYFYYSIYGLESCDYVETLYRDNTSEDEVLDEIIENYYDVDLKWINSDFNDLIEEIIEAEEEEEEEEETA